MEYDILQFRNRFDLIQAMQEYERCGWEPLGGISVAGNEVGYPHTYTQAVVRRKPIQFADKAEQVDIMLPKGHSSNFPQPRD